MIIQIDFIILTAICKNISSYCLWQDNNRQKSTINLIGNIYITQIELINNRERAKLFIRKSPVFFPKGL